MDELKDEFQISKTIGIKEYDQFMDQNPTEQQYMMVAINKIYKDKDTLLLSPKNAYGTSLEGKYSVA